MGFILYLISVIMLPTIYAACIVNGKEDKVVLDNSEIVWITWAFCVFWFLTIPMDLHTRFEKWHKKELTDKAENIVRTYIQKRDRDGNNTVITVSEKNLKIILKAYRKKYISLDSGTVEMVRNELLHRNMERNLLK